MTHVSELSLKANTVDDRNLHDTVIYEGCRHYPNIVDIGSVFMSSQNRRDFYCRGSPNKGLEKLLAA